MKRRGLEIPDVLVYQQGCLRIIDQRFLPSRVIYRKLSSVPAVAEAIRQLQIRGAPWIGVAAAYGMAVAAERSGDRELITRLTKAAEMLMAARPTAVNLGWAVSRIMEVVEHTKGVSPAVLRYRVFKEAKVIEEDERRRSRAIARHGAKLVPENGTVMTICNTGMLAGPGLGTALGVIYQAYQEGKNPLVYVCETRPLLQGARLTAWELKRAGINFRLIVDSASAGVIEHCDLVIVGADRIAANGDTANKIGTRMLALLAKAAGKPFYVAAPSSTFDLKIRDGKEIPIEIRSGDEITRIGTCGVAPAGITAYNPAFDVTPARYIAAFITEKGVVRPPYRNRLPRLLHSVVTKTRSITTGGRT
ncbi:MAG: S-methyl-5-thioribose-1-phosphate isomerase [candidate division WOR-3 bacterium]